MKTICVECSCLTFTFNERLGETVCDDCGLVQIVRPFEESVKWSDSYEPTTKLGSGFKPTSKQYYRLHQQNVWASAMSDTDRRTISQSAMILSQYSSKELMPRVSTYLTSLNNENVFKGVSVECRASALTYYLLKEAGVTVNIKRHSDISNVDKKYISRFGRRIAKHFRKAHIFSTVNASQVATSVLDKLDNVSSHFRSETMRMIDYIDMYCDSINIRFTSNRICAVIWIVSVMEKERQHTQELIRKASGNCSIIGIRLSTNEISGWFGLPKEHLLSLSVSDFTSGVY